MNLAPNTKRWGRGLLKSTFHGVGQGLAGFTVGSTLKHVLTSIGVAMVIALGFYLSENPLPPDDDDKAGK